MSFDLTYLNKVMPLFRVESFTFQYVALLSCEGSINKVMSHSSQPPYGLEIGCVALVILLLILSALFSGLTLAICSLELTRLQVLSRTGTDQQQFVSRLNMGSDCCFLIVLENTHWLLSGLGARRAGFSVCPLSVPHLPYF